MKNQKTEKTETTHFNREYEEQAISKKDKKQSRRSVLSKKEDNTNDSKEENEIMDWEVAVSGQKKMFQKNTWRKRLLLISIVCCIIAGAYFTVVYSNIPFIEKWRTIYIETAMTTNSHQWLATCFFPKSVIDKVMENRQKNLDAQVDVNSTWEDDFVIVDEKTDDDFFKKYWELNSDSFKRYMNNHPELSKKGYASLKIEDIEGKQNIKTTKGDAVLVVDVPNDLMIIGVKDDGYQGKMAIVKRAENVELVKSKALGSYGQEAGSFGADHDALLVINASGFVDVDGVGTGGEVKGSLIIDGVEYGKHYAEDYTWKFCGMKKNNKMYVSDYPSGDVESYRWGVEFLPALIVDGKSVVDGTFGMGIQPRAAIGQSRNGDVLMLIVDGRQVGYSIGCTVEDCKNILMRYNAYQGMNLDGGSSAVMWYNGKYITKSSSVSGIGRYMPDAIIVKKEEVIIPATPEQ